ncbi:MAG: cupin domain-containing protein [Hyphomicrobium sp.]
MSTTAKPPAGFQGVIDFAAASTPGETYSPPADRILSGNPVQTARNLFQSTDGRFNSGIWECQPGKWRVVFTESEFCQLLAGVLVVTGDDGSVRTFKAGDAFVSPAGFTGTWDVQEPAKKVYAFYE